MKRVLVFGTFDLLHEGHKHFLQDARSLGDYMIVVVARRHAVIAQKGRAPVHSDIDRLCAVLSLPYVDEAYLGDKNPGEYQILKQLSFSVLAVGYDQVPSDTEITEVLRIIGKSNVVVRRLNAFAPETYKTSRVRATMQ